MRRWNRCKLNKIKRTQNLNNSLWTFWSPLKILKLIGHLVRRGHLNRVVQATLLTTEALEKLNLKEVKLRAIISAEGYLSYKYFLKYTQAMVRYWIMISSKNVASEKTLVTSNLVKTTVLAHTPEPLITVLVDPFLLRHLWRHQF